MGCTITNPFSLGLKMQIVVVVLLVVILLALVSVSFRISTVQKTIKKIDEWDAKLDGD